MTDATGVSPSTSFGAEGDYQVTLTVNDGRGGSDSITQTIQVRNVVMAITSLSCLDPVVEGQSQSCQVHVETDSQPLGSAHVSLYDDATGAYLGDCVTDSITGGCSVQFTAGSPGTYTVYAVAEKTGFADDDDHNPMFTYDVVENQYQVAGLAVFNDPAFSNEDYDFFRGETMYVKFRALDPLGQPTNTNPSNELVTAVKLVSPPGGSVDMTELQDLDDGYYYYSLHIPATHEFLGDSQTFVFAFDVSMASGDSRVVNVRIRNNEPQIFPSVDNEFASQFSGTSQVDLTPYGYDVEDSGANLNWMVTGYDTSRYQISVDQATDVMTIVPLLGGSETVTLRLYDLDGAFATRDVALSVQANENFTFQCNDGVDNDGDGLTDMDDPDCTSETDNNESTQTVVTQCSDGVDNDGDGLTDMADPGCSSSLDDDESDITGNTQCSDGIDNDGDGAIDLYDSDCTGLSDDNEFPDYQNQSMNPACSDGIDNDGDGYTDLADSGCYSAVDDDESNPALSDSWPPAPHHLSDELRINRIDIRSAEWIPDTAFAGGQLWHQEEPAFRSWLP